MWLHTKDKFGSRRTTQNFIKIRLYLGKETTAEYAEYFASCPCSRGFTMPEQKARILNEFKVQLPPAGQLPLFHTKASKCRPAASRHGSHFVEILRDT